VLVRRRSRCVGAGSRFHANSPGFAVRGDE
jgi:hypothetical protein